uniref:Uncharacterized protein n=1 Tax=Anguilla anguilla TaxID=7936 RepID=A0A0E9PGZ6_ANGAN
MAVYTRYRCRYGNCSKIEGHKPLAVGWTHKAHVLLYPPKRENSGFLPVLSIKNIHLKLQIDNQDKGC